MGTLSYMAPEVLRGQPADARSDVWALGVILYELASGQRPFAGQTPFEVSAAILNGPPTALPDSVPRNLRMVIERCLAKPPGERYPHAGELRAALEAIEPGAGTLQATSKTAARSRLSRARLTAPAIVAVALLALLAFDIWGVRRWLASFGTRVEAIAVLPFDAVPGTDGTDYGHVADGVQDALSTELARVPGIARVIAQGIDATCGGRWQDDPGDRPGAWRDHGRDGRGDACRQSAPDHRSGDRCRDRAGALGRTRWPATRAACPSCSGTSSGALSGALRLESCSRSTRARLASAADIDARTYRGAISGGCRISTKARRRIVSIGWGTCGRRSIRIRQRSRVGRSGAWSRHDRPRAGRDRRRVVECARGCGARDQAGWRSGDAPHGACQPSRCIGTSTGRSLRSIFAAPTSSTRALPRTDITTLWYLRDSRSCRRGRRRTSACAGARSPDAGPHGLARRLVLASAGTTRRCGSEEGHRAHERVPIGWLVLGWSLAQGRHADAVAAHERAAQLGPRWKFELARTYPRRKTKRRRKSWLSSKPCLDAVRRLRARNAADHARQLRRGVSLVCVRAAPRLPSVGADRSSVCAARKRTRAMPRCCSG